MGEPPQRPPQDDERGVGDALRAAIERTMRATAGPAASTRERAGELLDEVVRRGREAGDELARRGQGAGAELARRGGEASVELARRLEGLERRLAQLEARLASQPPSEGDTKAKPQD